MPASGSALPITDQCQRVILLGAALMAAIAHGSLIPTLGLITLHRFSMGLDGTLACLFTATSVPRRLRRLQPHAQTLHQA